MTGDWAGELGASSSTKDALAGPPRGDPVPELLAAPGRLPILLGEALNGLLILGVECFDAPLDV